jgi:hypothetical protein
MAAKKLGRSLTGLFITLKYFSKSTLTLTLTLFLFQNSVDEGIAAVADKC